MDITSVKTFLPGETQASSAGGNAAGKEHTEGFDFAEIIRKNSLRLGNNLNAISDRAGITAVSERTDPPPQAEARGSEPSDEHHDGYAEDTRSDRNAAREAPVENARRDEPGHSNVDDAAAETNVEAHGEQRADHSDGNASGYDEQSAEPGSEHASEAPGNGAETAANDGADTDEGSAEAAATGENGHAANANGQEGKAHGNGEASTAEQMLGTLLAAANTTTHPGQAQGNAAEQAKNTLGRENAIDGLATAVAAVTKRTATSGANTEKSQTGDHGAQANANAQAQANANAHSQLQKSAETQAQSRSVATDQAAQMSRIVGDGNKVQVSVEVVDDSKTLISKPRASLASNAVLAGETNPSSQRPISGATGHNAAPAGLASQAADQAATATAQMQQAATQAAGGQAQAAGAAAFDAKAAVQGPAQAGPAQTVAVGGESAGAPTPGGTAATHQAQQNTSAQAANAPRFTQPQHALTDQVSVQISKALNAGVDKISIHLKPAEMGRVDVKMEVSHDGRLTAVVTADNKNTLDMLQRDSKELQQALQNAGLDLDNESLSFNLREQQGQGQDDEYAGPSLPDEDALEDGETAAAANGPAGYAGGIISDDRVDIQA